jgi:hypothetical protein
MHVAVRKGVTCRQWIALLVLMHSPVQTWAACNPKVVLLIRL